MANNWQQTIKDWTIRRKILTGFALVLTLTTALGWQAIRALYASVADTVIIPLQDALGLDNEARMNTPGQARGNWEWRFQTGDVSARLAQRLRALARVYERSRA